MGLEVRTLKKNQSVLLGVNEFFFTLLPTYKTQYTAVLSTHNITIVIKDIERDNVLHYGYLLFYSSSHILSPTFNPHNDPLQ